MQDIPLVEIADDVLDEMVEAGILTTDHRICVAEDKKTIRGGIYIDPDAADLMRVVTEAAWGNPHLTTEARPLTLSDLKAAAQAMREDACNWSKRSNFTPDEFGEYIRAQADRVLAMGDVRDADASCLREVIVDFGPIRPITEHARAQDKQEDQYHIGADMAVCLCGGRDGYHYQGCYGRARAMDCPERSISDAPRSKPVSGLANLGAAAEARIAALPNRRKPTVSILTDIDYED
jgi:hypothetical protein